MNNLYILDTETASFKGGVCEIAWLRVDLQLNVLEEFQSYVDPERPIEESAFAVHGITADMIEGKPTLAELSPKLQQPLDMVAHRADFDKRMIKDQVQVANTICSLRIAQRFIKGTTNHKLETLQKELGLPEQKSHSALGDVHTVRDLLLYVTSKHEVTFEELVNQGKTPQYVHIMPFGKYQGRALTVLPADYREFLLTLDLDSALRMSLERLRGS